MYVCKTMRLCSYLLQQGFNYEKIDIDKTNSNRNVWLFKQTPELWESITKYSNRNK